jgi:hypothetical protein
MAGQISSLSLLMIRADLDYPVVQTGIEIRKFLCGSIKDIAAEMPLPGTLFCDSEFTAAEQLPHLIQLARDQPTEERMDTGRGKEVTLLADAGPRRGVVTVFGVVKALLHEMGKTDATPLSDQITQQRSQRRVFFRAICQG